MADLRNRKNVITGAPDVSASGGITLGKVAEKTEHIPKNVKDELAAELAAIAAGYIGNDGITKTVDRETEKIKDWNGDTVIVLTSEHSVMLKLVFLEGANAEVLKMIAGENNVTVGDDGSITVVDNADDLPHRSMDFHIKSQAGRKIRVFAPDAQVTNVGDVVYVRNDVIKYEVEIECFSDIDSNKLYSFISPAEDAAAASPGGAANAGTGVSPSPGGVPGSGDTEETD